MGCANSKKMDVYEKEIAFQDKYIIKPLPDKFDFLKCLNNSDKYLDDISYKGDDDII